MDALTLLPMLIAACGTAALIAVARFPGRRPGLAAAPPNPTFWIQVAISAVILAAGLWTLLRPGYSADVQKIASGFVGTVIGFWFKS